MQYDPILETLGIQVPLPSLQIVDISKALRKLRKEALIGLRNRGHKRISWDKTRIYPRLGAIQGPDKRASQNGTCLDCLREVWLDTYPSSNSIEIAGEACAIQCTGKDRTIERIAEGYLECAAWASTQGERSKPIDDYRAEWTQDARLQARKLARSFYDANSVDAEEYFRLRGSGSEECFGHDLFLTQNHHGTGFWDRGLGELGERLRKAAHAEGEQDCYVHKGRIYFT